RYMIESNKPKVFLDAINFGGSSGASGEAIEEVPTASLRAQPADGAVVSERTPKISANLGGLAQVDPASVKMRVSGLGLVPAKYDRVTKIVSYRPTQPLRSDACSVIVEAKAGGQKVEARWSFTLQEAAMKAKDEPALPSAAGKPAGTPKH
ncbi:MAG TPA: hypothetical protein VHW03_03480, partial [Chthoniobacterales bacterium]|nr:hypothetical protein [Chthoniobacterales bacterium]